MFNHKYRKYKTLIGGCDEINSRSEFIKGRGEASPLPETMKKLDDYNSQYSATDFPDVYYCQHPLEENLCFIFEKLADHREFDETSYDISRLEDKASRQSPTPNEYGIPPKRFVERWNLMRWMSYRFFFDHNTYDITESTRTNKYDIYLAQIIDLSSYEDPLDKKVRSWIEEPRGNIKKIVIQMMVWIRKEEDNVPIGIHFYINSAYRVNEGGVPKEWASDTSHIVNGETKPIYPNQSLFQ